MTNRDIEDAAEKETPRIPHVTLRWLYDPEKDKPKLKWPGLGFKIDLPRCDNCHEGPPTKLEFICPDTNYMYCWDCMDKAMKIHERKI